MTNLRQQIEEIENPDSCRKEICTQYRKLSGRKWIKNCRSCRTNRICLIIDARARVMNVVPNPYIEQTKTSKVQRIAWVTATYEQLETCKSYLMGELK
jgi:hypothetical protein